MLRQEDHRNLRNLEIKSNLSQVINRFKIHSVSMIQRGTRTKWAEIHLAHRAKSLSRKTLWNSQSLLVWIPMISHKGHQLALSLASLATLRCGQMSKHQCLSRPPALWDLLWISIRRIPLRQPTIWDHQGFSQPAPNHQAQQVLQLSRTSYWSSPIKSKGFKVWSRLKWRRRFIGKTKLNLSRKSTSHLSKASKRTSSLSKPSWQTKTALYTASSRPRSKP